MQDKIILQQYFALKWSSSLDVAFIEDDICVRRCLHFTLKLHAITFSFTFNFYNHRLESDFPALSVFIVFCK